MADAAQEAETMVVSDKEAALVRVMTRGDVAAVVVGAAVVVVGPAVLAVLAVDAAVVVVVGALVGALVVAFPALPLATRLTVPAGDARKMASLMVPVDAAWSNSELSSTVRVKTQGDDNALGMACR